ncbi:MAG: UDP-N-acetylmuramoyl-L-alanyl-D-glutamate--2,6-diaminopimelate ligase [Armatimonadetes bacterium]|nr:UDP-N-acetylmuramoyl-L-alanyl-D-glutamate--2,6-diaminopimelate ligase [Armatimonadota bacterium]
MTDPTPITLEALARRVPGSKCVGDDGARIAGITHDSRLVAPGWMMACLVGASFDGHDFVGAALQRGAAALLVNADRRDTVPQGTPALLVPDTRLALPEVAAAVYGDPSEDLRVAGVSGTNGKSTIVQMLASIAESAGLASGRIGTLGAHAMGQDLPSEHTTPESDDLQRLLARMRDMGVRFVAMEVSSHGLALHRTDATRFAGAVFTNLTQDHLDFHGTMDSYFQAKLRLFAEYPLRNPGRFVASVNADDPRGEQVARVCRGKVVMYGLSDRARIRARDVVARATSTSFVVDGMGAPVRVELPIGGSFQVMNALAAIALTHGLGFPTAAIVEGLGAMAPVPGRFEAIPTGRGWDLVVDFAHTPAGLESLLASARALNPRRVLLVMGCGGDRDNAKRPLMGRISSEGADAVYVTSDNPRHEDPMRIIGHILDGIPEPRDRVSVEPDRRLAIEMAVRDAVPGDLLLIAGKGGETYTIVGDEKIPYDDRIVAREALGRLP